MPEKPEYLVTLSALAHIARMEQAALESFHPATRRWFTSNLGEPTPIQIDAWAALSQNNNALISAPTGEGKTLAGFLAIIDKLICRAIAGENIRAARILYISPLKALSNDVEKNLQLPLRGIQAELKKEGIEIDEIHAMVRTGDTSSSDRAKLIRLKPQIVVTTPESFYLLLTSESGRALLQTIETVIVDEVHALVSNRRGAHLTLSLARLAALTKRPIQYVGISATVKPLERVAKFLVGDQPIVYCEDSKKRPFDVKMLLPAAGLSAVMSGEAWAEIYQKLADEIKLRRTTLIFVNNRRLSERLARHLSELLGSDVVASHHGSLSYAQRHRSEQMLKAGLLKVMVATSSLELGLDIGSIDLVVQISSPRSIHAFIQRVGRSEHHKGGTSRALFIPLSRDDLLECVALVRSLRRGELEDISLAAPAFDVLAQQIIAEVSLKDYGVDELFSLFTHSYIYKGIEKTKFIQILEMLNDGYSLRFGRKARYIFYDKTARRLHTRPGTRIYAALNGGAIPENFEYEVVDEPNQAFVGTVHEDFAIESIQGDVFQLGNRMWQITSVRGNRVSVFHAPEKHPTIPFWIVDVPGRSDALSHAVSSLSTEFSRLANAEQFAQQIAAETELGTREIHDLAQYLQASFDHFATLPTQNTIVLERFFDEVRNCHIVLHSPFGTQINRAWGLALRKRFCRQFNFELQAAANDNAIILSLSHTHSFALEEVFSYLNSKTARDVLIQALLDAPMFEIRWRWNASRALAILRRTARGKTPAQWQKSNAQDLIALLFPDQIACAENISGPRQIPDHPLVEQTLYDCLHEAMDADGFLRVLKGLESGAIKTITIDSADPSPLAHEIINARPYAFLDDAPLEERRTRAVRTNFEEREGYEISDATLAAVTAEAMYPARNAFELYDRITQFGVVPEAEVRTLGFAEGVDGLIDAGKIVPVAPLAHELIHGLMASADKLELVRSAYEKSQSSAIEAIILSHLELLGPMSVDGVSARLELAANVVTMALLALENAGSVFQLERKGQKLFVERAFYQRLLHYNRRPRNGNERLQPKQYLQFLTRWQHVAEPLRSGESLRKVLYQLQGVALSQDEWLRALRRRVVDASEKMLEEIFLTGEFIWFKPSGGKTITKKSRYMILSRGLWYKIALKPDEPPALTPHALRIYDYLSVNGASFLSDIHHSGKFLSDHTLAAMRELVAKGLVTSDQFFSLQRLSNTKASLHTIAGRFALLRYPENLEEYERAVAIAEMQLARQGVIYRYAAENDFFKVPWPKFVKTLRLMEMQGRVRGGRFIEGLWGEQFADAAALASFHNGENLSAVIESGDPIYLVGRLLEKLRVVVPERLKERTA